MLQPDKRRTQNHTERNNSSKNQHIRHMIRQAQKGGAPPEPGSAAPKSAIWKAGGFSPPSLLIVLAGCGIGPPPNKGVPNTAALAQAGRSGIQRGRRRQGHDRQRQAPGCCVQNADTESQPPLEKGRERGQGAPAAAVQEVGSGERWKEPSLNTGLEPESQVVDVIYSHATTLGVLVA